MNLPGEILFCESQLGIAKVRMAKLDLPRYGRVRVGYAFLASAQMHLNAAQEDLRALRQSFRAKKRATIGATAFSDPKQGPDTPPKSRRAKTHPGEPWRDSPWSWPPAYGR